MQNELRKDLSQSESFMNDERSDFNRTSETLNFAYFSLTRKQQLIYDYMTGSHGKRQVPIADIAKKLRMEKGEVIRERDMIVSLIKKYSGGYI